MLSKISGLLKYCYEDNACDKLPDINLQLFLIMVKSLMPFEDNIGCMFDLLRYEKEIEIFKCYKSGHDDNLEYYYDNKKPSEKDDELLEFKIIPVIVANTQWDILINETLKASFFYSTNKTVILNTIILSSAINEYLSNENYMESINEVTKERIINFSLKDFLYNNNINLNKSSLIEFEKERIKFLSRNEFFTNELIEKYKSLNFIFNVREVENYITDNETVLSSFSLYLFKLRKGIINPEKLKIPQYNTLEIKEFLKYSSFSHPLLGRCKVIKRGEKEVILKNKSGLIKVNI
jgi:hypothetical protein